MLCWISCKSALPLACCLRPFVLIIHQPGATKSTDVTRLWDDICKGGGGERRKGC